MAYKTLLFGTDDFLKKLIPYFVREIQRGTLEITNYAVIEKNEVAIFDAEGKLGEDEQLSNIDLAIVFSKNDFYRCMKFLETQGFSRNRIIDGRVFQMPNLDFLRFLQEGIAYGVLDKKFFDANSRMIYPKVYGTKNGRITLSLGTKSYIRKDSILSGDGLITLGKFSSFATNISFKLGENFSHNYLNVGMIPASSLDWEFPKEFFPPQGVCKILIGNDVWCGSGSTLKCTNPNKPLVIGDGAVIASDSVVVKNVPPYAIVGGNPAQIIKYRFPPHVIEALQRIKWWDWDIDKIHDNFKYFNDIEKFIAMHDKE